jgi:ATP-binding cassette subfamily C protein
VIKAMGMLDGAARLVQQAALDSRSAHDVAQRRSEVVMLVSKPLRALAQVLIMGTAAWLVLEQQRSPGIIFATSLLFGRALAPVEGAMAGWKAFATALAAYRRLNGVMASATRPASTEDFVERPKGSLVINNVGAAFPGTGHLMLKGASFRLAPGECLGIIGPSGSGKSTLGRIIAGVCSPTVGSVRLGNIDVLSVRDAAPWRLGYLPQDIDLFGETVKDIIARLDGGDLRKVIAAARLTGLHEPILGLPHAYDTVVMGGGTILSRGFRQRLGLARAFYGDPHLVVLDEPNASLDSLGERMLLDAIEQLKAANTTVIIITHRIGILAATDKIAIMQGGMISAFGDSEEIYERYLVRPQLSAHEPAAQQ